jgi:hypothetical protein
VFSRSMIRLRMAWVTQAWVGWAVMPSTRTRRLACWIVARMYWRCPEWRSHGQADRVLRQACPRLWLRTRRSTAPRCRHAGHETTATDAPAGVSVACFSACSARRAGRSGADVGSDQVLHPLLAALKGFLVRSARFHSNAGQCRCSRTVIIFVRNRRCDFRAWGRSVLSLAVNAGRPGS